MHSGAADDETCSGVNSSFDQKTMETVVQIYRRQGFMKVLRSVIDLEDSASSNDPGARLGVILQASLEVYVIRPGFSES